MVLAELCAALLLALGGADPEEGPSPQGTAGLRVGQWVKVKGSMDASGIFIASEVEVLRPEDNENLTGTVERVIDRERFILLGQQVRLSGKTEWEAVSLGDLEGARVRVQGHYRGVRNFAAREISRRGSGRDAIEGRIDRLIPEGPFLRLAIMGFTVQVRQDLDVGHELPLERIPLAPAGAVSPEGLVRNDEDEVAGLIRLGDTLTLGGRVELETTHEENYDLNEDDPADRTDHGASARLELVWAPRPDFFSVLSGQVSRIWREDEDDGSEAYGNESLSRAYFYWRDALDLGWDLQFGRQRFDDQREWIYDQNLDAVRLIRSWPTYRLELSAATTLSDGSPRDENSLDLMAYLSNNSERRHLALYVVDRRDQDDPDEHLTHVGGRVLGNWIPRNQSWLELAGLFGTTADEDVRAYGLDLGTTWLTDSPWTPDLTAGWAFGSGDGDATDGTSHTFRQTGLQDNNDKFSGVTSFRYYGELVDPELANLSVITLGLGKRLTRNNSLDLVWHRLDQVEAAAQLINTDLRSKPDGINTYLGWEADLVFGSRSIPNTQLEVVLGYFEPGDAFPDADPAWLGRVQLRFRF